MDMQENDALFLKGLELPQVSYFGGLWNHLPRDPEGQFISQCLLHNFDFNETKHKSIVLYICYHTTVAINFHGNISYSACLEKTCQR